MVFFGGVVSRQAIVPPGFNTLNCSVKAVSILMALRMRYAEVTVLNLSLLKGSSSASACIH